MSSPGAVREMLVGLARQVHRLEIGTLDGSIERVITAPLALTVAFDPAGERLAVAGQSDSANVVAVATVEAGEVAWAGSRGVLGQTSKTGLALTHSLLGLFLNLPT